MTWLPLLFALLAPAPAAGLVVETGDPELSGTGADAVAEARHALSTGDFDRAAALYRALAEAGGGDAARLAAAVALYEGGQLRPARTEAEVVLAHAPQDLAAQNLLGLILVDSGSVADGLVRLQAAQKGAESTGNNAVLVRVLVNVGLARLDQGDAGGARTALARAKELAAQVGDSPSAAAAAQGLVGVDSLGGNDAGIGAALGRGDLKTARQRADAQLRAAKVSREQVTAALDLAAVQRAEGDLDGASARLQTAIRTAREAGMAREVGVGLGQLGLVYALGGRLPIAADTLKAGVNESSKGGYRVAEVDLRCELGLVLIQMDRADEAEQQQRAAGSLLAAMDYPQGVARQAELGGQIAAWRGDIATANSALSQAVSFHEKLGHALDAARVATLLSAAWQSSDPSRADQWAQKAVSLYAAAGEKLGAAHVALARALADARAQRLPEALRGFATAAQLAEAVGGGRASAVARVAREDAAQTLVMLGAGQDVAKLAAEEGVGDLVKRQADLKAAFDAYDVGLASYNARQYTVARDQFVAARRAFEGMGETAYALRARRAAAWAQYNTIVSLPTAQAYPQWTQLVEETTHLDDPELSLRVYAAAALGAHALTQGDPRARLVECGRRAEQLGLAEVAARCHGALAERDGALDDRAREARTAYNFSATDQGSVYALYVVAVDAYNAGRLDLARELALLARPNAGSLAGALDQIIAESTAP